MSTEVFIFLHGEHTKKLSSSLFSRFPSSSSA
jgi:hypothetical protein